MSDHLWLVNLQEVFKNQKYILIVKPRNEFNESLPPIEQKIEKAENSIKRDIMLMERNLNKGVDKINSDVMYDLK